MYMPLSYRHANAVFAEHPVGDPFGGAAYGKMEKSKGLSMAIGIVAGVATAGAGWGMMSAGLAAKGSMLGAVAGGAMFAGGIATSLGAVTGNKRLSKVGTILSLAGGVGSLAADVAAAGSLSGAQFGKTAADGWAKTMADLDGAFSSVLGTGGQSAAGAQSAAPTIGLDAAASAPQGSGILGNAMGDTSTAAMFGPSGAPATTGIGSTSMTGDLAAGASLNTAGGTLGSTNMTAQLGTNAAAGAGAPAAGAEKGLLGKAMDFAQTPAGMNLVGNTLQGMASGDAAQQQLDFLQQQYGDRRADLERELANLNFQYEVIDPFDPQADQKRQAARAKGIPTIDLGVNPNAKPVQPAGVTMNANQMKVA